MSGIFDKYFDRLGGSRPRRLSSSRGVNTRSDSGIMHARPSYGNIYGNDTGASPELEGFDSIKPPTTEGVDDQSSPSFATHSVTTAPNVRTQYSWTREKKMKRRPSSASEN